LNGNWNTRIKCDWCGNEKKTEYLTSKEPVCVFDDAARRHGWVRYIFDAGKDGKKAFHFCARKCRSDFIEKGYPHSEECGPSVLKVDDSSIC